MPPSLSTLSRAAIPTLALLASGPSSSAAAPVSALRASSQPAAAQPAVTTPVAAGGIAFASSDLPTNGLLARILDRQLTIAGGSTIAVRGRATTVAIIAELRVGRTGRLIKEAHVAANRRFRLQGLAHARETVHLVVRRADGGAETNDRVVGTVRRLAFRSTTASWYGPGLFGNRTACGQTLTPGLRGVAHKQLPCGTRLTVRFHGRSTSAVVVDRGPFHSGREFDLTYATAHAIGFHEVGQVQVSR